MEVGLSSKPSCQEAGTATASKYCNRCRSAMRQDWHGEVCNHCQERERVKERGINLKDTSLMSSSQISGTGSSSSVHIGKFSSLVCFISFL